MKSVVLSLFVALTSLTVPTGVFATEPNAEAYPKGEWGSLFNGKDLTGWTPKIRHCEVGENFGNT